VIPGGRRHTDAPLDEAFLQDCIVMAVAEIFFVPAWVPARFRPRWWWLLSAEAKLRRHTDRQPVEPLERWGRR
jgi:hypothetical protein